MSQYAKSKNGQVLGFFESEDAPTAEDDWVPILMGTPVAGWPDATSPSQVLHVTEEGELYWVETLALAQLQVRALLRIDQAADEARLFVVGDAARITEYSMAQRDAEAYQVAGYTGTPGPGVAVWTHAKRRKGWTHQQAAEDILAARDRWMSALVFIRQLRLDTKELIRDATSPLEVESLLDVFNSTLTAAMAGVP